MNEKRDSKSAHIETELTPEEKQLLQAWLAAPAPGEEALTGLAAPRPRVVAQPSRRRWGRMIAQHCATGALLFVVGYAAGHWRESAADGTTGQTVVANADQGAGAAGGIHSADDDAAGGSPVSRAAMPPDKTVDSGSRAGVPTLPPVESVASGKPAPAPHKPAATDCKPPEVYQGKDGHFRIDTVLCQSGSRATWVINPRLEIATATQSSSTEKKQ